MSREFSISGRTRLKEDPVFTNWPNRFALILIVTLLTSISTQAGSAAKSTSDDFADISTRGRILSHYQWAVSSASISVTSERYCLYGTMMKVAEERGAVWVVVFGNLNPQHTAFEIACEVRQTTAAKLSIRKFEPPESVSDFFFTAAMAIYGALGTTDAPPGFEYSVIPGSAKEIYVYVTPVQLKPNVSVFGGDVRYLISTEDYRIIEKRVLHKTVIFFNKTAPPPVAGVHTHVLSDLPEDTDVSYVLSRAPKIPEYVNTKSHVYLIQTDGSIVQQK
jgi:hypothetical protein